MVVDDDVCCDPAQSPSLEACVELSSSTALMSVVLAVSVDMYDGLFVIDTPSSVSVESYVCD